MVLTCREMVEFLMAYLDGELPEGQRESFDQHLRDCPPCEVYLDTYRRTVDLGRSVCEDGEGPDDEPPPGGSRPRRGHLKLVK